MTFIQQAESPYADRYMEATAYKGLEIYLVTRPGPASQCIPLVKFRESCVRVSGLYRRHRTIVRVIEESSRSRCSRSVILYPLRSPVRSIAKGLRNPGLGAAHGMNTIGICICLGVSTHWHERSQMMRAASKNESGCGSTCMRKGSDEMHDE